MKLLWTREQDISNDSYRPASHHLIQAAVNQTGHLTAWRQRIAGSGILDPGPDFPYDCANIRVELSYHELGVPTGSWRSTSHAPNAFARECMIDELAERAGQDPLAYRLSMLTNNPRMRGVVQRLAQAAAWGQALPPGHGRGIALHPCKESFVAQVAEVSVAADGKIRVQRVVCAVDCGLVVNPDTVKAQLEGAIIFGLTATLKSAISVRNGRIAQSNFNDFPLLRINESPAIEVHLLESLEPPGGIGEPGVPPIAPAVANAVYAATGKRVRQLPIALG